MKVIVTGVTGQDGSYMVRYLLNKIKDVKIYGTIRRLSVKNHENIEEVDDTRFELINLDITDQPSIISAVINIKPDFIFNFAAQSFVGESWNTPVHTFTTNTLSVMYFLEAIRMFLPSCRFYSAGSSEEFGDVDYLPQDINHPCKPRSPYGASKCAARHIVKVYRESYNLFAIHCILFNHEGTRRGKEFVTRKITSNIARIKKEIENNEEITPLELGNIYAKRDWSDSDDFMEGVWLMMNSDTPREYVLSSNETHTVKEFVDLACKYANLNVEWVENKENELDTKLMCDGKVILKISEKYFRPAEVDILHGDSTETRQAIGWEPKSKFEDLVKKMIDNDIKKLKN